MATIDGKDGSIVINDVLTMSYEDIVTAWDVAGEDGGEPTDAQVERVSELAAQFIDAYEVENVVNDAVYDIMNEAVARAIEAVREEA